jgi:hypothetical protein
MFYIPVFRKMLLVIKGQPLTEFAGLNGLPPHPTLVALPNVVDTAPGNHGPIGETIRLMNSSPE